MSIIDQSPFPFTAPMAQQLWRDLMVLYPIHADAIAFAQPFEVDPTDIQPNLTLRQLWYRMLQMTAIKGTTRDLVTAAWQANRRSMQASFLRALLDNKTASVSSEPFDQHGSGFDDRVSRDEALLFEDDLTMPVGEVPNMIATLGQVLTAASSVCLLRVTNAFGQSVGTGFKIASDLVLTNAHVLFPFGDPASQVYAEFGYDVDRLGASTPVIRLSADPTTIIADTQDDWAVIRDPEMDPDWPALDLGSASEPKVNSRAYILQHPNGQPKRLGFVRNTICGFDQRVVHYLTDTQPGSSGSPVFDEAGRLIALHHRGGQLTKIVGRLPISKNQGIRISRVLAGLKSKGLFQ